MKEIDYKELLKKYIRHVKYWEGTTFIGDTYLNGTHFTDEEIEILTKLKEETT